jgi:hypothetical protein
MTELSYRRSSAVLWILLVPAVAYFVWQARWPWWTGDVRVDGGAGVVLGLFICSRPAANAIDLFFAERGAIRRLFTRASGARWLLLNALVMTVGWFLIVTGAGRLTMAAP